MKDKVIVITGASSGIGAVLAKQCADRGAKVVLVARREKELHDVAHACGPNAFAVTADITHRSEVNRVFARACEHFGHVDVWVNNAGRGITRNVSELTDEDIDEMMLVNVKAPIYGIQAALPHFKSRGTGHIINVSSLLGRIPFAPFRSAYAASKHALNSLTTNLRMELREQFPNIHVTLVSPGVVATEFGVNSKHGGMDSRTLPGAQPVDEVAAVIVGVIEKPSNDVYTRDGAQKMIAAYYGAVDLGAADAMPMHAPRPASPKN